ncbi:unnamed protein product [Effrenium voratum]|nr:unnamed protein product [Effrenium voratum]
MRALRMLRAANGYGEAQPIGALAPFRIDAISMPEAGWVPVDLASLWGSNGDCVTLAQADLKDAFYHLSMPGELRDYFALTPVRAGDVGMKFLNGQKLKAAVEAAYRRATDQLKAAGLQVHDEECERGGKVLGWELTSDALFQPSRSRAWQKVLQNQFPEGTVGDQLTIYEDDFGPNKECAPQTFVNAQQTEMTLANTATSRSAKKRQRAQSRSKVKGDPVSGKTSLQLASVSKQCLSHYTRCWNSVKQKLVSSNGKLKSVSKVDEILSRELDRLYHNGEDISAGQYLIAAVVFFNNQLKSPAMQNLPHVKQSLKGWRKLAPQKSRLPIPWEVCCLLITHAVRQNLMGFALHMGLMFMLYLRPSEALRLRRGDVIPPVPRGQGGYKQWTVVLHPEELGVPSKTQEFDESLQLDLAYHHGFGEAIARFCENRKIAKRHVILTHTTAELLEFLETAQESLNLQAVNRIHPYRFRHGGASHDHKFKMLAIDAAANLVSTWQRVH